MRPPTKLRPHLYEVRRAICWNGSATIARLQLIRPISCAANRATHGARRSANPLTLFVRCPRTLSVVQQCISALRGDRRAVARGTQVLAPRQCPLGHRWLRSLSRKFFRWGIAPLHGHAGGSATLSASRAGDTLRLRLAGKDRKLIRPVRQI